MPFDLFPKNPYALAAMSLVGLLGILALRLRESRRPVTARTIVIPPLAMSTGFFMFLRPEFRVPWTWALGSFSAGALLLAYPLQRSSRLTREKQTVMLQRSRAFVYILLGLAVVRFALHEYVDHILPVRQTGALFFLLAFGMIARWRLWMLFEFRRLRAEAAPTTEAAH